MLFNSSVYIFLFLPCSVLLYFFLIRWRFVPAETVWLVLASLFFYRYWKASYLFIMVSSILVNYAFGTMLHSYRKASFMSRHTRISQKTVLVIGVLFNLGLLGYFKYTDFFVSNINIIIGTSFPLPNLVLPLAISFFTFQQIAYLVDCSRETTKEYSFINYCLFVSFFPQLIAGPIVHHREMMPQFSRLRNKIISYPNIALGLFFFSMGFFKKVCIADQFSVWVATGFDSETVLTFFDAWGTSLSYTFQLYFDFSGYTDMAIGSALFFNVILPVNFNSPYKACSIREFWRRWHITLSRWLRDYLYIPLGGNRKGRFRTYLNLFITFCLAGLWHGPSWSFVLWGGLHGLALVMHRIWIRFGLRMPSVLGWLITFLFVNASWVIFRAKTLQDAIRVLKGMCGFNGLSVTSKVTDFFQGYADGLRVGSVALPSQMYVYLLCFGMVLILFPNSCQIGGLLTNYCTDMKEDQQPVPRIKSFCHAILRFMCCFRPNCFWAVFSGILFSMALYLLLKVTPTEFLYFNF